MTRLPTWLVHQIIALVFGIALILPVLIHLNERLETAELRDQERFSSIAGIVHAAAEAGR